MEIIDLTHTFEENMPVYPGEESPHFEKKNSYQKDGFQVIRMNMLTHSGTHLDTPAHFINTGLTTDKMPLTDFYGRGLLIDCSGFSEHEIIGANHIKKYALELSGADFALIYTGWSKYWGKEKYFGNFPVMSDEAVRILLNFNLKGIGLDMISIDQIRSENYLNHVSVLGKGLIIIENLTKLDRLVNKNFHFAAFPLKIRDGDGSPIRAAAILE